MAESSQDKLPSLSQAGKYLIIVTAFFGWFFGGMHMAITSGSMRSAAKSLHIQAGGGQPTAADESAVNARLKQFDANGDGRLAGAEISLAFFDANTNSILSADEVVLANFNARKAGVLVDETAL